MTHHLMSHHLFSHSHRCATHSFVLWASRSLLKQVFREESALMSLLLQGVPRGQTTGLPLSYILRLSLPTYVMPPFKSMPSNIKVSQSFFSILDNTKLWVQLWVSRADRHSPTCTISSRPQKISLLIMMGIHCRSPFLSP